MEEDKVETNNKNDELNNETNEEISYPSAKLLLDLAYKEYIYETESKKNLETKTGICLALSGTVLTMMLVQIGGVAVPYIEDNVPLWKALFIIIHEIMYVGTIGTLIFAIYKFIDVLMIAVYQRLDIEESSNYTSNKEDEFSQFILGYIADYITFNNAKNYERSIAFSKGLKCIKISIAFMVGYVIFKSICSYFKIF